MKIPKLPGFIIQHKKRSLLILGIFIVLGIILFPKNKTTIETYTVKKEIITESITASGTVTSQASVNLSFLTAGKLATVNVKKGDNVEIGQVIATLDQRTVQTNLENTLRDYTKQRNTFEQTKDDQGVSSIELSPNSTIKRILENNQYDLEKSVASVELQTYIREQSVLISPIEGVVTRADVEVAGVNITAAVTYTVTDPGSMIFQTDVDEADVGKVVIDQKMNIVLDAYPDEEIKTAVNSIDFASHTTTTGGSAYTVSSLLPEKNSIIYRVGMNGDTEIIMSEKTGVIVIPISSLFDDTYVYVQEGKEFKKVKVVLGIQSDTDIEIKKGLTDGQIIALIAGDAAKQQNPTLNTSQ